VLKSSCIEFISCNNPRKTLVNINFLENLTVSHSTRASASHSFLFVHLPLTQSANTLFFTRNSIPKGGGGGGGGGGGLTPFCCKCDVIFSYIYTKSTKLILNLSYLVRLDCFSIDFNIHELLLKNSYFGRNMHKNALFSLKNCKKSPNGGFAPRPPIEKFWLRRCSERYQNNFISKI